MVCFLQIACSCALWMRILVQAASGHGKCSSHCKLGRQRGPAFSSGFGVCNAVTHPSNEGARPRKWHFQGKMAWSWQAPRSKMDPGHGLPAMGRQCTRHPPWGWKKEAGRYVVYQLRVSTHPVAKRPKRNNPSVSAIFVLFAVSFRRCEHFHRTCSWLAALPNGDTNGGFRTPSARSQGDSHIEPRWAVWAPCQSCANEVASP